MRGVGKTLLKLQQRADALVGRAREAFGNFDGRIGDSVESASAKGAPLASAARNARSRSGRPRRKAGSLPRSRSRRPGPGRLDLAIGLGRDVVDAGRERADLVRLRGERGAQAFDLGLIGVDAGDGFLGEPGGRGRATGQLGLENFEFGRARFNRRLDAGDALARLRVVDLADPARRSSTSVPSEVRTSATAASTLAETSSAGRIPAIRVETSPKPASRRASISEMRLSDCDWPGVSHAVTGAIPEGRTGAIFGAAQIPTPAPASSRTSHVSARDAKDWSVSSSRLSSCVSLRGLGRRRAGSTGKGSIDLGSGVRRPSSRTWNYPGPVRGIGRLHRVVTSLVSTHGRFDGSAVVSRGVVGRIASAASFGFVGTGSSSVASDSPACHLATPKRVVRHGRDVSGRACRAMIGDGAGRNKPSDTIRQIPGSASIMPSRSGRSATRRAPGSGPVNADRRRR